MSTHVFWFSGTGNSLAVAKRLAAATAADACLPITAATASPVPPHNHLILVFPVYAWGVPAIVERFIAALPQMVAGRATVVVTHGGAPGPAAAVAAAMLAEKGIARIATHAIRMVDNFPPFGGPPRPAKAEKRLLLAAATVAALCVTVANPAPADSGAGRYRVGRLLARPLNALFRRWMKRCFRKFRATAACTGCGLCQRICPVANIEMADGRPVWHERCEACFACFHWCPESAVAFGRCGPAHRRYHHPEIEAKELCGVRKSPPSQANEEQNVTPGNNDPAYTELG